MKKKIIIALLVVSTFTISASCTEKKEESNTVKSEMKFNMKNYALQGANVLCFGPDNVLFVGDSRGANVLAFSTEAKELKDPVHMNFKAIDRKIAGKLGIKPSDLIVNDMKVHPLSQDVYIAVKRGHSPKAKSLIVIVDPKSGDLRFMDVKSNNIGKAAIENPVTTTANFWKDIPASTLTITDMDFHQGKLYVAGLTNGEFASSLRMIPYPFNGKQTKVGSIEMYHAVHTQNETRAPIRSMVFEDVNGESTLIASYTCTPLVTIPSSEVKDGKHIKAKTIAELGYGNIPVDMIAFTAQEQDGSFDRKLLITHKYRSGSLISLKDLAKANEGNGLTGFSQGPEGVKIFPVPMAAVMNVDEQNQMMLALVRRNIDNGSIDLISQLKGAYFRLSDFINEYDFEDYNYTEGGKIWKDFHNMIKPMEGYPELTRDQSEK
jgi:hypothetical protein